MRARFGLLAGFGVLVGAGGAGPSADRAPGLVFEVRPAAGRDGSLASDATVVRTLALRLPSGEPATPFVSPGPFTAEWRGFLDVPRRDDYVFSFRGRGELTLEIDGEVVVKGRGKADEPVVGEKVRLKRGARQLVAHYQSTMTGIAALRVSWECRKFARESIPATVLSHDPGDAAATLGEQRRAGRMLIATRRCTACHRAGVTGMPELAMRGPDLHDAGARLTADWVRAWIADPRALRDDARMPRVLSGSTEELARDAADLAAFVTSLGAVPAAAASGDAQHGARLWADLGCFACHAFTDDDDGAWIVLDHAAAKFRPGALATFLLAPNAHEPWLRMPDLKLEPGEAADLEAFVRQHSAGTVPAGQPGDAVRGRARFAALCASCHDAGVEAKAPVAPDLDTVLSGALDRGCLAAAAAVRGVAPEFSLDGTERAALRAFAAGGTSSLTRDTASEFAARQMAERRCDACHVIDDRASRWSQREDRLAAVDVPPRPAPADGHVEVQQLRPALTWAGEKLRRDWLEAFLTGKRPSPRPWLHARMPRQPVAIGKGLADGLAAEHGLAGDEPTEKIDPARVAIGKQLIEQQGGFGCVTCHAVGDRMPAALFEVEGIQLGTAAHRLRHEWYREWMLDPPRFEPGAKMPKFADDDGHTPLDVLGGDARAQFDAIWQFMQELPE